MDSPSTQVAYLQLGHNAHKDAVLQNERTRSAEGYVALDDEFSWAEPLRGTQDECLVY